jgi:hypothetical protein
MSLQLSLDTRHAIAARHQANQRDGELSLTQEKPAMLTILNMQAMSSCSCSSTQQPNQCVAACCVAGYQTWHCSTPSDCSSEVYVLRGSTCAVWQRAAPSGRCHISPYSSQSDQLSCRLHCCGWKLTSTWMVTGPTCNYSVCTLVTRGVLMFSQTAGDVPILRAVDPRAPRPANHSCTVTPLSYLTDTHCCRLKRR